MLKESTFDEKRALSPQQMEAEIARAESMQEKIDLMNNFAWRLRISDPDRAIGIASESLALARTLHEQGETSNSRLAASLVILSFLDGEGGKLDSSLARSLEALSLLKDQPQADILIGAWFTLGWAYYYSGDYPAALEFGLKSLKLAREIGHQEWEAWCLDLTASTYKDPTQVLQMYRDDFEIFKRTGNIAGQSRILNNWAYTLMESKEYDQALEVAQKSLEAAKRGNLKRDIINITATIAETLASTGDLAQAQSKLHNATLLFDEYGRDISSVYILVELGQVYLKQNQLGQAEETLERALELSGQMEMRNEQSRCHLSLSELYEQQGMFQKALGHYKKFQALRESISGEGALKQLAAVRVSQQIETARRDAEIHRLQKEKLQIELDEHKRVHAILEDLATRDPLTNLFNRRHFLILAEQEWKRAVRYKHPLCALMLDVDHFKQINDRHGHAAGDKALTTVANVIRSTLRSTEIAGRYGGDEFVVILPETLPQHGVQVARRICRDIAAYTISSDTGIIEVTPSIGVACRTKDSNGSLTSLDDLLHQADKALYTAKKMGRGQAQLFVPEPA